VEKNQYGADFEEHTWGVEFALLEVLALRLGRYTSNRFSDDHNTWGFTVQSAGITRFIYEKHLKKRHPDSALLRYLFTRTNVQYNSSTLNLSGSALDGTRWWEFSLSF
jgi:hypothetical protein